MIADSLKQYKWMYANWPLSSDVPVTPAHFEDLRKMALIVFKPACGHYPETDWEGYTEEDTDKEETTLFGAFGVTDIAFETYDKGELIIRTSLTKFWETREAVSIGCWRTKEDLTVWEALVDITSEDNTTAPAAPDWRQIENPIVFEYVNNVVKQYSGWEEFTTANFNMPDIHPAAGQWINTVTDSEWDLRWNWNKYHSFDFNSLAKYIGHETNVTSVEEYFNVHSYEYLQKQLDAMEINKPWVYQGNKDKDFKDRDIRFKSIPVKAAWKKENITEPTQLGAFFGTEEKLSRSYGINQYWIDNGIPNDEGSEWYNPKLCDSFQTVIETLACNNKLCWPVNDTYKTNWALVHDEEWDENNSDCCPYPKIDEEYWGCNGSGFEFILSQLGTGYYDWYLDVGAMTYTPDSVQGIVNDNPDYVTLKGLAIATWRRTWKYTMGRAANAYMRPSEMGEPEDSGLSYSIWDGSDSETEIEPYWCGIHVSEIPDRDEFDEGTPYSVSAKTNYSVTVNNGIDSHIEIGDMIRVYHDADDIEDDVMAWVVSKTASGSNMILGLSHSITSLSVTNLKINYSNLIAGRHDPVGIKFNPNSTTPYPKYKLKWQMLQHAFEVLDRCVYYRCPVTLNYKGLAITKDTESMRQEPVYDSLAEMKEDFDDHLATQLLLVNEDEGDPGVEWYDMVGPTMDINSAYSGKEQHWIDGAEQVVENYGAAYSETLAAVQINPADGYADDWEFMNFTKHNANVLIQIRYEDKRALEDLSPDDFSQLYGGGNYGTPCTYLSHIEANQAGSVNSLAYDLVAYDYPDSLEKYGNMYLSPDDDGWCIIRSSTASMIKSANYKEEGSPLRTYEPTVDGVYNFDVGGWQGSTLTFHQTYILMELDFNAIPKEVFVDPDGRDRIGAEEPDGIAPADVRPPDPDPLQISIKPKMGCEIIEIGAGETDTEHPVEGLYWRLTMTVTAVDGEDLENNGIKYKATITPFAEETVPEDTYSESSERTIKLCDDLTQEEALGANYTYSGTPQQVGANWRYGVTHNGKIHIGDSLYFPSGLSGSGAASIHTVVDVESNNSFCISNGNTPSAVSDLSIWDISGYNEEDWLDSVMSDWQVSMSAMDNVGNETAAGESLDIELPDRWPLAEYLAVNKLNLNMYLMSLE